VPYKYRKFDTTYKKSSIPLQNSYARLRKITMKGMNILEVKVFDNDVERALRVLKNKLSKSGLFKELKLRRAYEKPSVKRKRKAIEARRRLLKARRNRRY
jgi:small subunit ribosomal protein S21